MAASTDLANQIQALDSSYDPVATYNNITAQLGIPDARTQVQTLQKNLTDTQSAIDAVDPSVTARTSGALVTEAQRGRIVNVEKQPLQDTYTKQNQQYGTDQSNLNDLTGQATQQSNLAQTAYSTKRQSLADQLTAAISQEQEAEREREFQEQQAEQLREFNVTSSQNATKIAQSGAAASAGAAASQPSYQQRSGGGFNFQDKTGKTISARLYAQETGTNFNTLLKQMAAAGDSGAADVLKSGASSAAYKALTWD